MKRDQISQYGPRFSRVLAREGIYLANHSLGRPLDQMEEDVREGIGHWYRRMDEAWGPWMVEVERFQSAVATILGAHDPGAIVPKSSAGQGLRAVLNAFPQEKVLNVVATRGEFDSLDFILKTYVRQRRVVMRWVEPRAAEVARFESADIIAAIDANTDVVVFPGIFFATGQILAGVDDIVAAAHRHGAVVILDVYHSAGVVPLATEAQEIDFVIGGCYKYLRGGPGACFLAIHPRVFANADLRTLDTGWFAKKDTFSYARSEEPEYEPGGRGWFESTFPILPLYQARSGLEFTIEIGVDDLRTQSLSALAHLRSVIPEIVHPEDAEAWGAFALLPHPNASGFVHSLRESGVTVDARGGFVRFCPDILNSPEEIDRAGAIVRRLLP